jgi:serine/threonine protein kinase
MIFEDPEKLKQRISDVWEQPVKGRVKIFEDTTAFMSIDGGDVLRLAGNDYLVLGNAREGRFGIDEQPKFWVKRAIDLTEGHRKIIKLVFEETFSGRIGAETFHCLRSARKEALVLKLMTGHPHFMQGETVLDTQGNQVRVVNYILGPTLFEYLRQLTMTHRDYYFAKFPEVIRSILDCFDAIAFLHNKGSYHGDIRADHLLLDRSSGQYKWIDFDYEIAYPHYDLFCLGNVLLQVVGKGRHSLHDISQQPTKYPDFIQTLQKTDMSLMFPHRVANLQKLFPYLPEELNEILMHFSVGSSVRYTNLNTLLSDLHALFPGEVQ